MNDDGGMDGWQLVIALAIVCMTLVGVCAIGAWYFH